MEMGRRFDVGSEEAMPPSVIWYGYLHRTMVLVLFPLCLVCEDMVHIQYFPITQYINRIAKIELSLLLHMSVAKWRVFNADRKQNFLIISYNLLYAINSLGSLLVMRRYIDSESFLAFRPSTKQSSKRHFFSSLVRVGLSYSSKRLIKVG